MDAREIVDAYLQGRIESWGVFRKLVRLGLSTATALAVAGALPAAVKANSADALGGVDHTAQESPILDLLVSHLVSQLAKAEADGSVRPLAATLARIGGNNSNLGDCSRQECEPINLNYNDGFNNVNGEIVPDQKSGNVMMNLNGSIGKSNVNLFAAFDPPANHGNNGNNVNVGKVNLNVVGNVGDVPLNFNGNLGNLNTGNIPK